jgi:hypothetical protein
MTRAGHGPGPRSAGMVQMHVPEHSRPRATNMPSGGGAAARMDPEAATELVRKGATLLLLDVPQRTLFGIDAQVGRLSLCSSRIALALLDGLGGQGLQSVLAVACLLCRCSPSGPSSKGSRWCPRGRISSTTAPPAGTRRSPQIGKTSLTLLLFPSLR